MRLHETLAYAKNGLVRKLAEASQKKRRPGRTPGHFYRWGHSAARNTRKKRCVPWPYFIFA